MVFSTNLRQFLEIPYDELEELNLEAKRRQLERHTSYDLQTYYISYLTEEKRIKAVTVGFTDLEGRFHMLDYDKKFLIKSFDNLTFDGSSIRGFSAVRESDLRLEIDWGTFRWLPADVFGPGKVMVFGCIKGQSGADYPSDMRGRLKTYVNTLFVDQKIETNIAVECEGFLFDGIDAEQNFSEMNPFRLVSLGGYYHSLPKDRLKLFIDALAEAQRALGFENEKDHPEVAPSQFELNYKYTDALIAADQVQLYKLTARQVAANMGMTACFLPKPISGINGSGMHVNLSLTKEGKNIFWDPQGEDQLSSLAWSFVDRLLSNANDICLIMNPSVNAYRRLDPHFEAPNQIKASAVDRTSMIRIPLGNAQSARIEVRTVAPDVNPYMTFLAVLKTGFLGPITEMLNAENRRTRTRFLPGNIYDAIRLMKGSSFALELLGEDTKEKFIERKLFAADRSPKELGVQVKSSEVIFHHEITNQYLLSRF